MTDDINRAVFDAYEKECERIAEYIREELPCGGEGFLDGRRWCEENDIPETVFADVINYYIEEADYGVTPMCPWKIQ